MASLDLRSVPILGHKFGRGHEEVLQRIPDLSVYFIDCRQKAWVFQPPIPKELPHPGPVLLFHMAVIVFVVRPRACEAHRALPLLEVADEVPVEELASIVAIKPEHIKRKRCLHLPR